MTHIFEHPEFNNHQEIHFFNDEATGLKAIIAIHRMRDGAAAGGCRFYPYPGTEEALTDVLRLSRAMTYKFALANIPMGGGKSVIIGDPKKLKTEKLLEAFGEKIADLHGKYTVGGDVGTNSNDMAIIRRKTSFAAGAKEVGGDTAPLTGYGVFKALEAAWHFYSKGQSLDNVKVAIQGFGGVGYHLALHLKEAGAEITIADINLQAQKTATELGFKVVETQEILFQDVDILSPCALGGVINGASIPQINAKIICGGANNQLKSEALIQRLDNKGILFVPDFISSAGGAIHGTGHLTGKNQKEIREHADQIYKTTLQVLEKSQYEGFNVLRAAYALAEEKLRN